jgi:hypothetical protein
MMMLVKAQAVATYSIAAAAAMMVEWMVPARETRETKSE